MFKQLHYGIYSLRGEGMEILKEYVEYMLNI